MKHSHSSDQYLDECRARYAANHRHAGCADRISTDQSSCPSSDSLARLAENRFMWSARKGLVQHLAGCSACADDYRVMREAYAGMQAALQRPANGLRGVLQWLSPVGNSAMRPAMLACVLVLGLCMLLLLPSDLERLTADPASLVDASPTRPPASAIAVAMADDVLFRSDFDIGQESVQHSPGQRQEVFADSFGG
jgi:hypothetical protein